MIGGEDVLMRPVLRGMLRAESLLDCSVDLAFVMLLNEAIDIEIENDRRGRVYMKQQQKENAHG